MTFKLATTVLLFAATLIGCDKGLDRVETTAAAPIAPDTSAPQLEKLQIENHRLASEIMALQAEVQKLKMTPEVLLANVQSALRAGDEAKARQHMHSLEQRAPTSQHAQVARVAINKFDAAQAAAQAQARAIEARGLYAIPVQTSPSVSGVTLKVEGAALSDSWQFDAYGDEWFYRNAERGQRFVVLRATVQSDQKDPSLPDIGIYLIDGKTMKRVSQMTYEFRRWSSHGTYIGLYHDYKNDFAHTSSIPFTAGAVISTDDAKRPLAVVSSGDLCHERGSKRGRPEVSYRSSFKCSLKSELSAADFSTSSYRVVAFLNRPKGN